MQKYFFYVSQMSVLPEIPLFGIIFQILDHEDESIEFSKNIFQVTLNDTSASTKQFFSN